MAIARVYGVRLFYESTGTGEIPLVLVHGSWSSQRGWNVVMPALAEAFRVIAYDRRGHSRSERSATQGSVREDAADLAGLIEHLGVAPAWVVGNSFGASIALRLAGERPDLLRGLIVHEPSLFSLLEDDPTLRSMWQAVAQDIGAVVERIACADHAGAARRFVDTVAIGPGTWEQLSHDVRQTVIENAPTFLDEAGDPEKFHFDPEWLEHFSKPILLTRGEKSPPAFRAVANRLAQTVPGIEVVSFPEAGHIPHATHPEAYVKSIFAFIGKHAEQSALSKEAQCLEVS